MVISEQVANLINAQISHELGNRLLYIQISSWAHDLGLKRIAAFFKGESDSEQGHADKFVSYLQEANTQVAVPIIDAKQSIFKDCDDVASSYVEAEATTTRNINSIWEVAIAEKDYATQDLLQWFSHEQVEEEGLAERFSNLVDLANGDYLKLDLMFLE